MMNQSKFKPHFIKANAHRLKAKLINPGINVHFMETNKTPSVPPPLTDPRKPAKIDLSHHMNVKEGDLVQILYGRDQGKQGVIRKLIRKKNCLIVNGMNMKKTFRVNTGDQQIGESLVTVEMPIHITNVAPVDPVIKKPTRVKRRYTMFGECVRVSKVSGCAIPDPVKLDREERERLYDKHQATHKIKKKYKGTEMDTIDKRHYQMLAKIAYQNDQMTQMAVAQQSLRNGAGMQYRGVT